LHSFAFIPALLPWFPARRLFSFSGTASLSGASLRRRWLVPI